MKKITPIGAISAHTSRPNTPESDRDRTVEHDVIVELSDGTREVVRIHAIEPLDALHRVGATFGTPAYAKLPRVPLGSPS